LNTVEEQNLAKPPKYVVEELFLTKRKLRYRDTVHTKSVLEKVIDIGRILHSESGQLECPVFKEMIDWMAGKTGISAY